MATHLKTKRRQLRISLEDDSVISAAAGKQSKSVSDYLVESALVRAQMEMADRTEVILAPASWDAFVADLDSAPVVNDRLVEAIRRSTTAVA